ncbi:MAG TPA: mechanosensitive ion channel family protein [Candidatus Dormibacteraeota bacterium]|nr:mechanosensitive ion channel family protein [Candidatus Dormibacteraeota bacterium]
MNKFSDLRESLPAIAEALLGILIFAALVWSIRRAKRWLLTRSAQVAAEKTEKVSERKLRAAGLRSFVTLLRALLNFASYVLISFVAYALVWYELRCFPVSKPWGDFLRSQGIDLLSTLGRSILAALPGLLIVTLIILAARMFAGVVSRLFAAAETGEIEMHRLDRASATTTRRLLVLLVWVIAAVFAYPYIPGSQSLAFKGITIFAGVLVSLGSTNLVNQIASGLLLVYSRAFQTGDYVLVGETEGTVLGIGLCVTRIRTIKNEEVHIANSMLLGTATKNYSRLAKSEGLLLPVKVTIGYSTPWRQVHALLLKAARGTPGLAQQPMPFVLQTRLCDFYVEYELNACLQQPFQRVWVQSDLHARIQDVFNEHGVQILSPHYFQDPPQPHLVPPADWFRSPAAPDRLPGNAAAEGK